MSEKDCEKPVERGLPKLEREFHEGVTASLWAMPLRVASDGTLSGALPCGHGVGGLSWRYGGTDPNPRLAYCCECASRSRQPKAREQVLEEALRAAQGQANDVSGPPDRERMRVIRRIILDALDWKPA